MCIRDSANTDWYLDRLSEEELDTAFIAFRNCETADPAEVANGYYDHVQMQVGPYKSYTSSLGFYGSCSQATIHGLSLIHISMVSSAPMRCARSFMPESPQPLPLIRGCSTSKPQPPSATLTCLSLIHISPSCTSSAGS